mgnify:CR=1 FL=1
MNKRGQSLPLNTLIITILVVIVLIVVAVFFLGGTSSLSRSIRTIFFGATAGTDISLAREICQQRCEQAKDGNPLAYCNIGQDIDRNGNGEIDSGDQSSSSSENEIGVKCPDLIGADFCLKPGTTQSVCV